MTKTSLHEVAGVECLNQEGVPDLAMPLPLYTHFLLIFKRYQCVCGRKFKSEKAYHNHYRIENESEYFMNQE